MNIITNGGSPFYLPNIVTNASGYFNKQIYYYFHELLFASRQNAQQKEKLTNDMKKNGAIFVPVLWKEYTIL